MITKIVLSFVGILILAGALGTAYIYYYPAAMPATVVLPPAAQPDNTVEAGFVTAVSAKSLSITKQDGTAATFTIDTTTRITLAGQGTSTLQTISDIKNGIMVVVDPSADHTVAQSIIIVAPPSAQ